jgi:hypothetical protein
LEVELHDALTSLDRLARYHRLYPDGAAPPLDQACYESLGPTPVFCSNADNVGEFASGPSGREFANSISRD